MTILSCVEMGGGGEEEDRRRSRRRREDEEKGWERKRGVKSKEGGRANDEEEGEGKEE